MFGAVRAIFFLKKGLNCAINFILHVHASKILQKKNSLRSILTVSVFTVFICSFCYDLLWIIKNV